LPVKFEKLILVDSAGIRPKMTLRQKVRLLVYKTVRQIVSLKVVRERYPDLLERWSRKQGSSDYRIASPRMRECLVKAVNEDLTPCLSSIVCETLLIWGENDSATPVSDAKIMEKLIPDSGLVVLENAGHFSFLDQEYVFGRVLDSFLNITR
jgi:pimeloyl-ACP methyl ester carboxylesterase